MPNTKGFVDPFLLLVLVGILAAVIYLIWQGIIPNPLQLSKKPQVELQTQYQNPFDKETQYVNPFSTYKNPFDQLEE